MIALRAVLRPIWRTLRILVATLLACVILLPSMSVLPVRSRWRRALRAWVYRWWGAALMRAVGARVTVLGPIPAAPQIVVSNHLSYLDIPLIAIAVDGVFVAKAEIRSWPFMGWVSRIGGTLFVDRSSRRDAVRVGREMADWIEHGYPLVFFPEGTSTDGSAVAPFRTPLLAAAAAKQIPVFAAAIHYRTQPPVAPARDTICWWGDAPFGPHARRLLTIDRFEATIAFSPTALVDDDRKRLADRLHDEVARLADLAASRSSSP